MDQRFQSQRIARMGVQRQINQNKENKILTSRFDNDKF